MNLDSTLSATISTLTAVVVFYMGIYYERMRQRKAYRKQFLAELDVNLINIQKTVAYSNIVLKDKSPSELADNENVENDETKLFITPLLDDAVMEVLKNGIKDERYNKLVTEYYALTKRYNWVVDRIKGFKIRLNALQVLVDSGKLLTDKITELKDFQHIVLK